HYPHVLELIASLEIRIRESIKPQEIKDEKFCGVTHQLNGWIVGKILTLRIFED
ncbi:unnamed protein product, partial [Allacma fusca]